MEGSTLATRHRPTVYRKGCAVPEFDHPPERTANPVGEIAPTITAMLENGPLGSSSIEVAVIEGRPPKTIDVPADDQSTCRYCLAGWMQSGRSATYTFLYRV